MADRVHVIKGDLARIERAVGVEGFALRVLTMRLVKEAPKLMPRRKVLRRFSPPKELEEALAGLDFGKYVVQLVGKSGMVIASVKVAWT